MDFLNLVTEARTCRKYQGERRLEPGTLSWLTDCARLSPSAANLQPLRYLAVSSAEKCAELYPALTWALYLKDWKGPEPDERPTGYIVLLAPRGEDGKISPNTYIDLGIAAQSIQQAAWTRGIGACMFRSYNPKVIAQVLPLPEGYEVVLVIALGYALEDRRLAALGGDGSIRYYRDEKGVHHVPKRDLKDVLLGEF